MKKEMSHVERVFAALERKEPDRVPIHESVVDEHVMQAMLPGCDYYQFNDWLGLDTASLNRSSWRKDNVQYLDEERKFFRDKWGVVRGFGPECVPYPVEAAIRRPEDLKSYTPPDPEDPDALGHLPEVVARYKGIKPVTVIGRDAFFDPSHVRGVEQFLMDMIDNPKFVHELIEVCQSYDLRIIERSVKAGADIVILGDDYADKNNPMMSPAHFKEFILPGLKKAIKVARDAGAYVVKHSDGNLWPILDMIIEAGPDALNPLEPVAGMDIGEVKAKYGDRVALIGNIDCGALLSWGTREEVRAAVRDCIASAAVGGGHLLSSSNSIHSSVKPENYLTMVEAGREFGAYPLS
ncbi:MAG: hypothetical protein HY318_04270 [Armatimonadetes bacterium]|nr:hypothetical protein [Armatimonadota bacterium]